MVMAAFKYQYNEEAVVLSKMEVLSETSESTLTTISIIGHFRHDEGVCRVKTYSG